MNKRSKKNAISFNSVSGRLQEFLLVWILLCPTARFQSHLSPALDAFLDWSLAARTNKFRVLKKDVPAKLLTFSAFPINIRAFYPCRTSHSHYNTSIFHGNKTNYS